MGIGNRQYYRSTQIVPRPLPTTQHPSLFSVATRKGHPTPLWHLGILCFYNWAGRPSAPHATFLEATNGKKLSTKQALLLRCLLAWRRLLRRPLRHGSSQAETAFEDARRLGVRWNWIRGRYGSQGLSAGLPWQLERSSHSLPATTHTSYSEIITPYRKYIFASLGVRDSISDWEYPGIIE